VSGFESEQGMALAEMAAELTNNKRDKWRKLFMMMRVKLKPHEIVVSDVRK
jgi:hypothetical protein